MFSYEEGKEKKAYKKWHLSQFFFFFLIALGYSLIVLYFCPCCHGNCNRKLIYTLKNVHDWHEYQKWKHSLLKY